MIREYAHLLRGEPAYAEKATRAVSLVRDLCEVLVDSGAELRRQQRTATAERVVFHPPCTLQHAQKIRGSVEALLTELGATVLPFPETHLCCGSAGTYSVLQADLSSQLRERKLANINTQRPDVILSANIGCIAHLAGASSTPVHHWIEWVDSRLHDS
jgi:glycolate oxidase iron-sulfur subunit